MKKKSKDVFEMARDDYSALLSTAVAQITAARNAIAVSVNTTAISTYWDLGNCCMTGKWNTDMVAA